MSFPRYPKYKPSGVEGLGDVPEHWEAWKLTHALERIGSGTTPKTDNRAYYDEGTHPWVNTGDLNDGDLIDCEKRITSLALSDHTTLRTYPVGSVVMAMYGATIGKLAILGFEATVNQACCVFAGESKLESKFLFYWLLGFRQQIISLASGGGQPNVNQDILRTLRVACPDFPEQTAIAEFLDRETGKIDGLVAEQRRLMELLKEKRQAVISHAVTKGLNPHAPMKPSGIEWLGDVPVGWTVRKVSQLFRAGKGKNGQMLTKEFCGANEGEYPVYSGQTENEGMMGTWDQFEFDFGEAGVLFSTTVGAKAMHLRQLFGRFSLSQNCMIIWTTSTLCTTRFFYYHFQPLFQWQRSMIPDHMQPSFRMEDLYDCAIALPPTDEQSAIVRYLDSELAKFDTLTAEAQRAIDLLQERRTALISAAVKGQIDVRQPLKN